MLNYCINYVKAKMHEEKGQGMVEYGLLVALIAVVVIGALVLLGPAIKAQFTAITAKLPVPTP